MMSKSRVRAALAATVASIAIGAGTLSVAPAQAASDHNEYQYSGSGRYLQANAWLGAGQKFGWSTSSKYLGCCAGPVRTTYIKNVVKIWVNGIGVSLGAFSGGTSSDKDFGESWTNYNAVISDLSGTNSVSNNLYFSIQESSTATASVPYFGTPKSTAITITKWA